MRSKVVSGMMLTVLLIGMLMLVFNIQPVEAEPRTIYIRADGSIDPPTPLISSVDNVTYTFTDNINDSIVIERDNIVVDGAGYRLQGTGSGRGIDLSDRSNVTISDMDIKGFSDGIFLAGCSNNTLTGNNITANECGIRLYNSSNYNSISGNDIANNYECGVSLVYSLNNNVSGNIITNNDCGIELRGSSFDNRFYHNNFINNTQQVYIETPGYANVWDSGYSSGGNYWSDYNGTDLYSGIYQNETGSDGIGDVPYVIDANNTDNYPLMRTCYYESRMTQVISTESAGDSYEPSLAVDSNGNVHVAWEDNTDYGGCGTGWDIFYKRFVTGSGWTFTEVVSTESTSDSYNPSLAVDLAGNVHVAWDDDTRFVNGYDSGADIDIFYKRYEVGSGWTFTEVVSTESTSDSQRPSLAVDLAGNVHVAWEDNTDYGGCGTGWDIFYKRFVTGSGWTFTEVVSTESTSDSYNPSLAVDLAGNVHVAWEDNTDYGGSGPDRDIFYKYLHVHSIQYPWPMFHHNLRNTGYTESPAPITNQTLWNYTTGSAVVSSPAVVDGKVYVGSYDDKVYCLDATTGAHIWNYTTGFLVASCPAVVDGKVYVGSYDDKVYCLDATTGAHIWNYTTGGYVWSSPAVVDGKVYVGSWDNKVYCLDASTGAHIWNYTTGDVVFSSPAVVDGKVYVGSYDDKVYCLDATTGAHVWNYTTGDVVFSSPAVVDGKVYVGSRDDKVYCLDASTGAHIWNYTTGGNDVRSSPAVADGKVYVGSRDGKVYCLDASTGASIWNYTTGGNEVDSSPAVADGRVYVGSNDNKVYCLDASTGASIWNYTTGLWVQSSPAVADGMVFIGSSDNTVYAFGVGWTSTEVVSTESTSDSQRPSLAVDSNGNVHVAWEDNTDYGGCGTGWDIFYKRFVTGSGWTSTEVVSTESTSDSQRPSLAVDLAGNVHVAWEDNTRFVNGYDSGADIDIFYKRYEVGSGWTSTEVVSTESTSDSQRPSLAVDLAGNVHVAWEDNTDYGGSSPDRDIFYKYLHVHFTVYPWSMFRHNLRNTGYTESPAPNTNQTLWNYTTGDVVVSSPAVADGKVYVGSYDDKVYCLDATTGAHIWNYTTGSYVYSSPAVADGRVYVGSDDNKTYCLDASTGTHIWNYTTGGGGVFSSPAVADGKVYVGSWDNKVYCLDALTGVHIWNYTTGGPVLSSPAVADGRVYVGSYDDKVYCLDASTGTHIWNYTTGYQVQSSPAVADGRVYVGSIDDKVYCLDASTGTHIWNYTTGSDVISSPAVADGKVYVGSKDDKVYCLDASTGASIWNYTTGDWVRSSPAVADGMVFVGSNDHTVYAFGNIIRVPEDYSTIQEAIDAADSGATILIAPGVYTECIVINKTLTIIGGTGCKTIFDGGGAGTPITITDTSHVIVTNFVIVKGIQGIFIDNSSDVEIYNNQMFYMNDSGIAVDGENASDNLVYNNTIYSNDIAISVTESSTNNTIYKNTISSNGIGLNLESGGNIIHTNTFSKNTIGINMSYLNGNTFYWNSFIDNKQQVDLSGSTNAWDNGFPSGGNYWSNYNGTDSFTGPDQNLNGNDGIGDTPHEIDANNQDQYPLMKPYSGPHDIGITNITTSKTVVGQGYNLNITIKTLNYGINSETFNIITAYANPIVINQTQITLTSRNSTIITFAWNTTGVPYGNYTISAVADIVPSETDTNDNTCTSWAVVSIEGDVDGDGDVDGGDQRKIQNAMFTTTGDPDWNPNADVDCDLDVDGGDQRKCQNHMFESW